MTEETPAVFAAAATVALHTGLAAAMGAAVSARWLCSGRSAWASRAAAASQVALRWALVLTALASVGSLWLRSAAMGEVPLVKAWPAVASVLSESHYGRAWLIGAAGLLSALAAAWWPPPGSTSPARSGFVTAGVVVLAWSRSVTGHAGADGDLSWSIAVGVVHLLSMALWAGIVFVGAFVLPGACGDADRSDRARWVRALSSTATLALGGVVATGAVNAWHGLGSPNDLLVTAYGNVLSFKLALVGVATGLGGLNRLVWMPRLLDALRGRRPPVSPALRRFLCVLRIESLVLWAVVVAAAVLGATEPGHGG